MKAHKQENDTQGNRRKFERVNVPRDAQVQVMDPHGHPMGVLRQVGRGGFMMEPKSTFTNDGKAHRLTIYDRHEDIRVKFDAKILYVEPGMAGFQFVGLDANNAVELGILIGKFYEAGRG
ncbi:MAG TPA: PilZ domain-containing protein [Candidatus Saccharimonadales bacterium]|nr:PilZ domain-containing protein [Candidatus Saccharimonadales bacterium]